MESVEALSVRGAGDRYFELSKLLSLKFRKDGFSLPEVQEGDASSLGKVDGVGVLQVGRDASRGGFGRARLEGFKGEADICIRRVVQGGRVGNAIFAFVCSNDDIIFWKREDGHAPIVRRLTWFRDASTHIEDVDFDHTVQWCLCFTNDLKVVAINVYLLMNKGFVYGSKVLSLFQTEVREPSVVEFYRTFDLTPWMGLVGNRERRLVRGVCWVSCSGIEYGVCAVDSGSVCLVDLKGKRGILRVKLGISIVWFELLMSRTKVEMLIENDRGEYFAWMVEDLRTGEGWTRGGFCQLVLHEMRKIGHLVGDVKIHRLSGTCFISKVVEGRLVVYGADLSDVRSLAEYWLPGVEVGDWTLTDRWIVLCEGRRMKVMCRKEGGHVFTGGGCSEVVVVQEFEMKEDACIIEWFMPFDEDRDMVEFGSKEVESSLAHGHHGVDDGNRERRFRSRVEFFFCTRRKLYKVARVEYKELLKRVIRSMVEDEGDFPDRRCRMLALGIDFGSLSDMLADWYFDRGEYGLSMKWHLRGKRDVRELMYRYLSSGVGTEMLVRVIEEVIDRSDVQKRVFYSDFLLLCYIYELLTSADVNRRDEDGRIERFLRENRYYRKELSKKWLSFDSLKRWRDASFDDTDLEMEEDSNWTMIGRLSGFECRDQILAFLNRWLESGISDFLWKIWSIGKKWLYIMVYECICFKISRLITWMDDFEGEENMDKRDKCSISYLDYLHRMNDDEINFENRISCLLDVFEMVKMEDGYPYNFHLIEEWLLNHECIFPLLISILENSNESDLFLDLPFSPFFYYQVTGRQLEHRFNSTDFEPETKVRKILNDRLDAERQIKWPLNPNKSNEGEIVVFSCGHNYEIGEYHQEISKFQGKMASLGFPRTAKCCLNEYWNRHIRLACPNCVYTHLLEERRE